MKKQILSAATAAVMAFTAMPFTVNAIGSNPYVPSIYSASSDFGFSEKEITASDSDTVFVAINGYCFDIVKGNPLIYFEDDSIAEICGSTTDYNNNTTELRIDMKKSGSTVLHVETPDGKSDTCKITVVETTHTTSSAEPVIPAEKLDELREAAEKYISENNLNVKVLKEDKYGLNDKRVILEIPFASDNEIYLDLTLEAGAVSRYIIETYGTEYVNAVVFCPSDLYEVREKIVDYIAENNLEEKGIVCPEFTKYYPDKYSFGMSIVIEEIDSYDYQAAMDLLAYFRENIGKNSNSYLYYVPVQNGIAMTTVPCDTIITTTATTAISTAKAEEKATYGDANSDGDVSLADAVFILQSLSNPDKYKLSEQGTINADVDGAEGVTANDALSIQKYTLHLIDELPENK